MVSPRQTHWRGQYRGTGRSVRESPWCPRQSKPRDSRAADRPIWMVPGQGRTLSNGCRFCPSLNDRHDGTRGRGTPRTFPSLPDNGLTRQRSRQLASAYQRAETPGRGYDLVQVVCGDAFGFVAGKESRSIIDLRLPIFDVRMGMDWSRFMPAPLAIEKRKSKIEHSSLRQHQ